MRLAELNKQKEILLKFCLHLQKRIAMRLTAVRIQANARMNDEKEFQQLELSRLLTYMAMRREMASWRKRIERLKDLLFDQLISTYIQLIIGKLFYSHRVKQTAKGERFRFRKMKLFIGLCGFFEKIFIENAQIESDCIIQKIIGNKKLLSQKINNILFVLMSLKSYQLIYPSNSTIVPSFNFIINIVNIPSSSIIQMKTYLLLLSILLIHTQCLGITCPSGQTVTSSDYVPTTNGCGSSSFQTMVADLINPYNDKFEGCCNTHDKCFGTCGAPNFKTSFDGCNSDFKGCMKSQCNKIKDFIKKQACNLAYKGIYTAVDTLGSTFYDGSQKKACKCSA